MLSMTPAPVPSWNIVKSIFSPPASSVHLVLAASPFLPAAVITTTAMLTTISSPAPLDITASLVSFARSPVILLMLYSYSWSLHWRVENLVRQIQDFTIAEASAVSCRSLRMNPLPPLPRVRLMSPSPSPTQSDLCCCKSQTPPIKLS
ncbi:hypothetical protein Bca4012_056480 [Brassica carinata]|uniref:Uncharacterized protein n=1 Tax=Brassica carinata TaxID=52824 RepID=A0A8X7VZD9_BRACI|nr:hypothetical protein Bca52824_013689 [Brassica carinata]